MSEAPFVLRCSGTSKQFKLKCYREATWAVRTQDGANWWGACYQHPHQVMKRLAEGGKALVVWDAKEAMAENERLRERNEVILNQGEFADRALDVLRPLVLDSDDVWTWERVVDVLAENKFAATSAQGHELLELLCEEHVVEHQGDGRYQCIASLPEYARYEPGT